MTKGAFTREVLRVVITIEKKPTSYEGKKGSLFRRFSMTILGKFVEISTRVNSAFEPSSYFLNLQNHKFSYGPLLHDCLS